MKKQKLPIRASSHRKEDISKRAFEELIEPWIVCGWEKRDYGIDATVEIHRAIDNSESTHPMSKRFLVQLKSTDKIETNKKRFSYPVEVKSINYWYSSNLPVLFGVYNLNTKELFYCWINLDDSLINQLDKKDGGWSLKETISIPMETSYKIQSTSLPTIEQAVFNWKIQTKKIIEPGTYFSLKEKAVGIIDSIESISTKYKFNSISSSLEDLKNLVEEAIYRIAFTGPSRVGKSTLINTLLDYEISPVDMFQTTGVPITFLPGRVEKLNIIKNDNTVIQEKLTERNIRKYASQQENAGNTKQIKFVTVFLQNKMLERGVAFYDIPGLDDPSDEIRSLTWMTALRSNAVIYMIDASPFRNEGFIFRHDFKKELTDLGDKLEKVFLVFNKVDDLHPGQLKILKKKISEELTRFGLIDKINKRIFYVSAKEYKVKKSEGADGIEDLEREIWEYLLKENKAGLVTINKSIVECGKIIGKFTSLLNVRLIDHVKRGEIEEAIAKIKKMKPGFINSLKDERNLAYSNLTGLLSSRARNALDLFERELRNLPLDRDLPGQKDIRLRLGQSVNGIINSTNSDYMADVRRVKSKIDTWITDNINTVSKVISGNQAKKYVDLSNIDNISFQDLEDYSSSVGMGLFTGILGLFIAPPVALIAGIVGFFMNWSLTKQERRNNAINKIINKSKEEYDTAIKNIQALYWELLVETYKKMISHLETALSEYFTDLDDQLGKLDMSMTKEEVEGMKASFGQLEKTNEQLEELREDVYNSYFSLS